jgi:hydrogenase expression/formation protein HypE
MEAASKTITMAHGSGGRDSAALMRDIFGKHFSNETLNRLDDAAVLSRPAADIAVSTDSFVVTPIEFLGGDIGKLAVCGTVNDVLMMGAVPKYLTCGFIIDEGLALATLDRIAESMARAAAQAGVMIVAGDTKVVERRAAGAQSQNGAGHGTAGQESIGAGGGAAGESGANGAGLFINTSGIGFLRDGIISAPAASGACAGDAVIVSGNLGDHHACILSARLGLANNIRSDCAVLADIVDALYASGADIHTMRDVTRGGLGTVLNEIAASSRTRIELSEDSIPVSEEVKAFCGIMGLEPLYMGNEGKMVAIVAEADAEKALAAMRKTENGKGAQIIGKVSEMSAGAPDVTMKTRIGGTRRISVLQGEGLPRIC